MRLKLLGCKVFSRELYHICANSKNTVEIIWMKEALHRTPPLLKEALQREIDKIEADTDDTDAILLGFGLCSRGIVGLKTKSLPLIAPKAHDCITLLLGGRPRYNRLFAETNGGVYWYSPGWCEQFKESGFDTGYESKLLEYTEKYGEENALYLIETEQSWSSRYMCAMYINWDEIDSGKFIRKAEEKASGSGLELRLAQGSAELLSALVDGPWDDDFLVLTPGQSIDASADENVIRAKAISAK